MDFGRLEDEELSNIEVKFPPIIGRGRPQEKVRLTLGLPVWGSDHFRGTLYPTSTKKVDYLKTYAHYLDTIELNTTHYNIPSKETVKGWREDVAENSNFLFFPKLPKSISHEGRLDLHFEKVQFFTESMREFGSHLGTCFLQVHPSFTPSRFSELVGLLEIWPSDLKLAVEVRHLSWFKNGEIRHALTELLRKKNVSWVVTDTPGIQDVLHQTITADEVLIRFVTTGFHTKDRERMEAWTKQFNHYAQAGVKDVYFFIHERDEWHCRDILEHMVSLNTHLSVREIPSLKDEVQQLSLF